MLERAEAIRLSPIVLPPVNRPRLARYLELPSVAQIDPITDAEVRRLDERRGELLAPWWRAVAVPIEHVEGRFVRLGADFDGLESTEAYARALRERDAEAVVVAALTLGGRVDRMIRQHLDREQIYEAFVLKQWAATMTEQARAELTRRLRGWAAEHDRTLLPFDGPGYNGWPLASLRPLLELLYRDADPGAPRMIRATESGVMLPTNSMLIVHGFTRHQRDTTATRRDDERLAQCHRCAMERCSYRVTPFAAATVEID